MSGSLEQSEGKPNLVPILDMVFQLITFFMLVINFKAASLDLGLKLPVIGSARPVDTGSAAVMVLNLREFSAGDWALSIYGQPRRDVESYIAGEAVADRIKLGRKTKPDEADEKDVELPTIVVIRGDVKTPFSVLYRVTKACQESGYRQFAFRAVNRRD